MRYAGDTVLYAENNEDMHQLLDIDKEENRKKGLELNTKKKQKKQKYWSSIDTMNVHRSTSLSTGINSSKAIRSNTWVL